MKTKLYLCLLTCGTVFTACDHQMAVDVRLVSTDSDPRTGTTLGPLTFKDCATRVFGVGRDTASLTVDNALARGRAEQKFRYVNGMSISRDRSLSEPQVPSDATRP